jgi:tellurite resistance protein TerC
VVRFKEAIGWTITWASLAVLFGLALIPWRGKEDATEFLTGYVIELSLSMDNVFVIAMIFSYFRVPPQYQHRVLFWGIMGALVMRGVMIGAGTALVARFHWTLYLFGAFLVYSGIKMLFVSDEGVSPEKNPVLKLVRRLWPVANEFHGHHFTVLQHGRRVLTPLALALVMVETADLIFALDSIPAIFAVTTKPFIVFTSNVFAILGLRSLYFVLAGAIAYFSCLKYGLSLVLVFIGAKMLLMNWIKIPTLLALGIVAAIITGSILISLVRAKSGKSQQPVAGA